MIKKRVYFIGGFDPRGAAFYHRLFREEAKKSTQLSGAKINTGKRHSLSNLVSQWQVDSVWDNQAYTINYCFLNWDDLIRKHWVRSTWALVMTALPMYCSHFKNGLFRKIYKAGKGPYLFSVYPLQFMVVAAFLILLVALSASFFANLIFQHMLFNVLLAFTIVYTMLKFSNKLGEKMGVWWVLQTSVFITLMTKKPLPDVMQRNSDFAEQIIQDYLAEPVDEIILVGHCLGSIMSISVMDQMMMRAHDLLKNKFTLVTLGQIIPYLSYMKSATHFRSSLQNVANNECYPWVDFGARADPLCFQQVNPAITEGVKLNKQHWPYRVVVKPFEMFNPKKYEALKKNKLRLHFQYLMAADIKTDYDYFEIITGPNSQLRQFKLQIAK